MRLKPNDTKQNLAGTNLAPANQCIQTGYARSAGFVVSIPPYHMMPMLSQFGQNYHYNSQHMPPLI